MTESYFLDIENKYLVSGPAPVGRILNYIKKIKEKEYQSSGRGPQNETNLDNWTVCFMVGLGLISKPETDPHLEITLTDIGEATYDRIKDMPEFIDRKRKSKYDMRKIKSHLISKEINLYQFLISVFLESRIMKNFALFLRTRDENRIEKGEFKEYGEIFGIDIAWFNRVPSTWQIAEFCGIIKEKRSYIEIIDREYINSFKSKDLGKVAKKNIREKLIEESENENELEAEIQEFIEDCSPNNLTPRICQRTIKTIKRNKTLARELKKLYQGKCQVCKFTFQKKDGENYSEIHHIIPLGEDGSDRISNMTILCANCHKKMHYAEIEFGDLVNNKQIVFINGIKKEIEYHPKHFQAVEESDI
ncbi:MAG: hypothetical protein GF308_16045 [Candidatus Heimdallarchaeota archaeon]|nr:hypothetical protein [Candidatus Heimdallarchaeota archaeon]